MALDAMIRISKKTRDRLVCFRHGLDTYDSVLTRLMDRAVAISSQPAKKDNAQERPLKSPRHGGRSLEN
jgi:hypothetical protein